MPDAGSFTYRKQKAFKDFVAENRSLGRKLIDAFKWVIDKIKSTFSGKSAQDAAAMDALGVSLADAEQALKLWEKAYRETKKVVKKAPIGGESNGVVRNMLTNNPPSGVNWLFNDEIIDRQQMAIFYDAVAKISKRGYYCPQNSDGLYIVDLGDVLAFTDANYDNPKIYKAVKFDDQFEDTMEPCKELIRNEEGGIVPARKCDPNY